MTDAFGLTVEQRGPWKPGGFETLAHEELLRRRERAELLAPTRPRVECGHPECTTMVPIIPGRQKAYEAGRPLFCSRAHREEVASAKVTVKCGNPECGKDVVKFRSDVERNSTGVFFCDSTCQGKVGSKPRTGTTAPCDNALCGKPVYRPPALSTGPRYCGHECRGAAMTGVQLVERPERTCIVCETTWIPDLGQIRQDVQTCSPACTAVSRRRKPGERTIDADGYAWITTPDGRNMMEHRWVMEQAIGRRLTPQETVHHMTGGRAGRSNNELTNLELWSGRHPKGHRIDDVLLYCREMLSVYGDDAEQFRYHELAQVVLEAEGDPAVMAELELAEMGAPTQ